MTNIEIKLRGIYNDLSNTERKIADYFFLNMETLFNLPIAELARQSDVSQVSWVRFCKALGYSGLKDMKKSLFNEISIASSDNSGSSKHYEFSDIKNFTNIAQISESISTSSIKAIEDTIQIIDQSAMSKIVDIIIAAKSVCIFGVGASGIVGSDLYCKLIRIGKPAIFDRDIHIQLTYASTMTKKDVAIFISNSGLTYEVLDSLKIAQQTSAKLVSLTRFGRNPLASACDYSLFTNSPEADKRSGATCSRIAQLALIDVLFTAVANRNYAQVEDALERSHKSCGSHKRKTN